MSSKTLRSIHVGVSHRGAAHRQVYGESPDWEIVGLVDISDEALAEARSETGLGESACFHSLDEALEKTEADAVVISTPPALHAPQVKTAIDAGCHVFVEKPFTYDLQQAEQLVQDAQSRQLCIVVGQNDRYSPVAQAFQDAVSGGEYGALGFVVVNHFKARRAPYHTTPHMHLWSQGVHQVDTLMAIVGRDVRSVFGASVNPPWCDWPSESSVFCHLEFDGGIRGEYVGTSNAKSGRSTLTLRAEFEQGALIYDSSRGSSLEFDGPNGSKTLDLPKSSGNDEVARLFHQYITTGVEPPISGRNNLKTLGVLDAVVRSTSTRASIAF